MSMEEAKESGDDGDAIKELVSVICSGIRIKEGESENFGVDGNYKDLVSKILKVPIGSNIREMFLLELLLNADAGLHTVWRESEVDKNKYGHPLCLGIGILPDEKNQTLSIIDTGIGMTRKDLLMRLISLDRLRDPYLFSYIGTVQKYSRCESNVDLPADLYIREFGGLGFFSAYMVAYKVVITTKQEGHDPYVWELNANDNDGAGGSAFSFRVAPAAASPAPGCGSFHRGTKVTLHLKDGYHEYLSVDKLQELVNKCEQLKHFYPIFIITDDNENNRPAVFRRLNEDKEEKVPIEELKDKYKGVQESFVEHIRDMAKNVDVVITDRARRVFCNLDVFEDGRKPVLEINPRRFDMEILRKLLESVKTYDNVKLKQAMSLPKGKEKENKMRLYKKCKEKKEDALKRKIREHLYYSVLLKFKAYDTLSLNKTCFYQKAVDAIGLDDKWRWKSILPKPLKP